LQLFDQIGRTLDGGADFVIAAFDYTNLSARPEADRVRALVENMFSRYPQPGRVDLRARFRSADEEQHLGAFLELALHELMILAGCVVELHPTVPGSGRHPDFLVTPADGKAFYLEATLATGRSKEEEGARRLHARALQAIDNFVSPGFYLSVSTRGLPTNPINGKVLRRQLERWLNSLDALACSGPTPPVFTHEEHGAKFEITAIPRPRRDGAPGRAIAIRSLSPGQLDTRGAIRTSVEKKAGRYGQLDRPYVIAVNVLERFSFESAAIDAMFGSEYVAMTEDGDVRELRHPNGAFLGTRPRNTRVSAVFSLDRLDPWNLGRCRSRLIAHPWARHCLKTADLFPGDVVRIEAHEIRSSPGGSLADALGLWRNWPEDQNAPTRPLASQVPPVQRSFSPPRRTP
jgi:hypothetical protein